MTTPIAQFGGAVREWLNQTLAPWLKALLQPLDRLLDSAPPWVGQACAVGLFVAAAIFVALLRRDYIYRGAPDTAGWRDLRLWAWLAMVPYVVLYIFFD